MKLKYMTGETVFARYLPVDSFGNTELQQVLFAEQINTYAGNGALTGTTDRIFAFWRYRITTNIPSKVPQETFASIKFDDSKFKEDHFLIYTTPLI